MVPRTAPQARRIGGVRAMLWESRGAPRAALLFIPGNPGLCEYYTKFLGELYEDLGGACTLLCKSSPGHDDTVGAPPPTGRAAGGGPVRTYYGVGDQVDAQAEALRTLRAHVGPRTPIVLAGHSMGAYVAMRLVARYPTEIQGLQCFFPTISHIGISPQGRRMQYALWPPVLTIVHALAWLLACLPLAWLEACMRLFTRQAPDAARVTAAFVRRPGAVVTALRTFADECDMIRAVPSDTLDALQTADIPVHCYWGRGDSVRGALTQDAWAPTWHRVHAETCLGLSPWPAPAHLRSVRSPRAPRPSIPPRSSTECSWDVPHAFCLRT